MPVTRLLLRMVATGQDQVPAEARKNLVDNLRRAGEIVRDRGLGDKATTAATAGDILELAFELADEPTVTEHLCRLTDPQALTAPLAPEILSALDRFARA